MTLAYEYTTKVEFSNSIGRHNILLRCLPARTPFQKSVSEDLSLSGEFWLNESLDGFGNRIISGGTIEWHSALEYSCKGTLECDVYCVPDANPHPMYLMPSRLTTIITPLTPCPPTPERGRGELKVDGSLAFCSSPVRGLGGLRLGGVKDGFLQRCLDIMHAVHEYVSYEPNTTHILTTAEETLRSRRGVCQDFAHLMVALCRKAGMPARYVCGLMQGEGATHAWVEVHDGQCWYAFDPTNDTAIASGYIKLAHGRDALDCPVSRGTYIGLTSSTTTVKCEVRILGN